MSVDTSGNIILVMGATGHQGGAVIRALLKQTQPQPQQPSRFRIRAMTRNPSSHAALKLKEQGVDEIVQGEMDDEESLRKAMLGVYGVFAVTVVNLAEETAHEVQQGKRIAQIAAELGIQHFVFTSVASADKADEVPHFHTKWLIEQYIHELGREKGLRWTILRPAAFMDYVYPAKMATFLLSFMRAFFSENRTIQVVSNDDIGIFTRLIFEKPDEYLGKTVTLAGDEVTRADIIAAYQRVLGVTPWTMWFPSWLVRFTVSKMYHMYIWLERVGYDADVPALRKVYPQLQTFEDFLRARKP